jgi:hypothetical protein
MKKIIVQFMLIAGILASLSFSCSLNTANEATAAAASELPASRTSGQNIIRASDRQSYDFFGAAVGLSGFYAVVGGWGKDVVSGGTTLYDAGAAYIYERNGSGTWVQKASLRASDAQAYDNFGDSVAISGSYAIVGAPLEDGGNGNPVSNAGAAYIFERSSSGTWSQKAILHASDMTDSASFGIEVAISGSYAVVATLNDAIYIFKRNSTWSQYARIQNPNGGTEFGEHVAIDSDKLMVRATNAVVFYQLNGSGTWEQKNFLSITPGSYNRVALGISGTYAIAGTPPYGAYIFEYIPEWGTWAHKAFVQSSDFSQDDEFGFDVSISGTYAAVGAYNKDMGKGAAYIFTRQSGSWLQSKKLTASDGQVNDQFGTAVDLNSSHYVIVGAMMEDGGSGNPKTDCGTAYIFE